MNTLSNRMASRLNELGLKQIALAEATKVSKGAVSKWVAGTTIPSSEHIPLIAETLKVSPEWLLTGKETATYNHSQVNQVHNSHVSGSISQSVVNSQCAISELLNLDFYPQANINAPKQTLYLTKQILSTPADFATVCNDDLMHPIIRQKAFVVARSLHSDDLVYPNKIYVLNMGGLLICRYLERLTGGRIRVYSEMDKEGFTLSQDEFYQEYQIMGGVVWWSSFMEW